MQKITLLLAIFLSNSAIAADVCDSVKESTLKVGFGSTFTLAYTNPDTFKHNLTGGEVIVDESQTGDLNRKTGPSFTWSKKFATQDYEVSPGQSLEILTADDVYNVYDFPVDATKKLIVKYIIYIQGQNPDGKWSSPIKHVSCINYTILK